MKIWTTLVAVLILFNVPAPASAAVYRCTLPDGRTVYQEVPCSAGEQKAVDHKARAALKEQQRRQEEEERRRKKLNSG